MAKAERMGLTKEERGLANAVGELARDFAQLPPMHMADAEEFAFHCHALQNIILSRAGMRDLVGDEAQAETEEEDLGVFGQLPSFMLELPLTARCASGCGWEVTGTVRSVAKDAREHAEILGHSVVEIGEG